MRNKYEAGQVSMFDPDSIVEKSSLWAKPAASSNLHQKPVTPGNKPSCFLA